MSEQGVRVLVVDDERSIRRFLKVSLGSQFTVFEATNGEEALAAVAANRPDVIILDLGLPDMDGVEVTRRLREWTQIPIIVVSVREQEQDKIAALDAGADDYLTKPFGVGELMARLRSALRRSAPAETDPVFNTGDLVVDLNQREVTGERATSFPDSDRIRSPADLRQTRRESVDPRSIAARCLGDSLRK